MNKLLEEIARNYSKHANNDIMKVFFHLSSNNQRTYPSTKRIDNSTEVNVYRYIGVEMNV
jgi:hypothetical protein